jgi:hypothetical protein
MFCDCDMVEVERIRATQGQMFVIQCNANSLRRVVQATYKSRNIGLKEDGFARAHDCNHCLTGAMREKVEVMLWNERMEVAVEPIRPNLDGRKSDESQKFLHHRPQNETSGRISPLECSFLGL